MLQNIKFRTRLLLGFLVVILLFFISTFLAFHKIRDQKQVTQMLYEHPFHVSIAVRDINIDISTISGTMLEFIKSDNKLEMDSLLQDVFKHNTMIHQNFDTVFAQYLGNKQEVVELQKLYGNWENIRKNVISLKISGHKMEAMKLREDSAALLIKQLLFKSESIAVFAENKARSFYQKANSEEMASMRFFIAVSIIFLIISIIIAILISSSISKPIFQFTSKITQLINSKSSHQYNRINEEKLLSITVNEMTEAYNKLESFNTELELKVAQRTKELATQNEEYAALNEEYVTLNDVLKEKNEEYSALNEELIEKNGEFETLNEELNEKNEEFSALNEELKERNEEFGSINEEYVALNEQLTSTNNKIRKINEDLFIAKKRAEESDMLKSAFLANMSHEIRTPINAIKGFSELLERPNQPPEKKHKFIRIINQRSDDLLQIINDILDISLIESGQLKLYETTDDVIKMVIDLQDFFNTKNEYLEKKPVQFIVDISIDERHKYIKTDFSRLKQVLINLVGNSFKFTASGFIEIGCSENNGWIQFHIKDSGLGIPPEMQKVIFNRFRQVDNEYSAKKHEGVGLGLSISKGLIELMDGEIWLESILNVGSTFYFKIPYRTDKQLIQKTMADIVNFNWMDKSILLVEDNQYNADYIIEILQEVPVVCEHALTGAEALQQMRNKKFDLVLLDIRLTDVSGFDLYKDIKLMDPEIIVIAQTAFANDSDRIACLNAGFNDYLSKPIKRSNLLNKINEYLA